MGIITIDESHQVVATLVVNTAWETIDFNNSGLQDFIIRNPKEAGRQFTAFLKNGGKFTFKESTKMIIDRAKPFNSAEFIGSDLNVWRGPKDGNGLEGEEEQDGGALVLTEVDIGMIRLENMLKPGETSVNGEEKLRRLEKAGHTRLDAKVLQTLWENQYLIPEKWKEKTNGQATYIFFDGTVLWYFSGDRYVLCLYWDGDKWRRSCGCLDSNWHANDPSAVLAN